MNCNYSNNNSNFTINNLKKVAILWLMIVIVLLLLLAYLVPKSKLNSNVLALLPHEQTNDIPIEIIDGFQARLDKQLIWLIKPTDAKNIDAVSWWYKQLQKQNFIGNVNGFFDQNFQHQWGQFAYQYRYQLSDEQTIERLRNHTQYDWILSQLYSPFSGISITELNHDPLLLTRAAQLNQLSHSDGLSITNNWLTVKDQQGNLWYMIVAELKKSSFNMSQSHEIVNQLADLTLSLKQQWPDTEILKRGILFYSDYASYQAKSDISLIGSISIIGIILLILVVFRSIRPVLLTILSIAVGILAGLVAVLAIFGEIHIITLVMSTSIIGIVIDYSLHYLTDRLLHGRKQSSFLTLTKLLPTLTVAICTSLIAYLILLITPFPGLKQLSLFAIAGFVGAFLTVVCWYPFLVKTLPIREKVGQELLLFWLKIWRKNTMQIIMVCLAIIFIGSGLSRLVIDDDIGRLQTLPTELKSEEQKIVEITEQADNPKWFIIYGQTAEQTLQRLEHFLPQLEKAKKEGLFSQYQTINLPSQQKQLQHIDIINHYSSQIIESLQQLGMTVAPISFEAKPQLITPEIWQQNPISRGRNLLWITLENGSSATLVQISGIYNTEALKKLALNQDGIQWLDRRQEFNDMFASYRMHITQLLLLAIAIICLIFIYRNRRFGMAIALKSTLPTLLSVGCAISILGLTNQPLNLFSMLALILVIGIGIDYTVFLSNDNTYPTSALLAVSMAALTTLLSFGLLVLSHTNAIVGFGLVLLVGIFTAFLFSPLVQKS